MNTSVRNLKSISQLAYKTHSLVSLPQLSARNISSAIFRTQLPSVCVAVKKPKSTVAIEKFAKVPVTGAFYSFSTPFIRHYSAGICKAMEEHCVVPDVIPCAPQKELSVEYEGNISVKPGIVLTPTQVQNPPKVQWEADPNSLYTLCMTDPDAPSRKEPTFREWHHWLVGNIPGDKIAEGCVLSAYIGSGPPKGTGLHRYVFLVYKQPSKLEFTEKKLPDNSGDGRGGFKISNFAEKYKLGNPIAGNFYQAEYDDYVDCLYKKLGAA